MNLSDPPLDPPTEDVDSHDAAVEPSDRDDVEGHSFPSDRPDTSGSRLGAFDPK